MKYSSLVRPRMDGAAESYSAVDRHEDWHSKSVDEVMSVLKTSRDGLAESEALKRAGEFGPNKLDEVEPPHWFWKLLEQFRDPMVYLLLAAAAIAFLFDPHDRTTPIFIVIALSLNGVFGFMQEAKAERAMDSLKEMLVGSTIVMREGKDIRVTTEELVPGDLVFLEEGMNIPADVRLIEVNNFSVNESTLTGESSSVTKRTDSLDKDLMLADRRNMAHMGTVVATGRGIGIVVQTAMTTELGRLASDLAEVETPKTPLEIKLESLGRFLGYVAVLATLLLVSLNLAEAFFNGLRGELLWAIVSEQFLLAVAIFVAIVPEGLPIILVITLSIGMRNMARHRAIIRRMRAVETLGSTTVICSDKTGTLTTGEMTVRGLYYDGTSYEVTGRGFNPNQGGLELSGGKLQESDIAELKATTPFRWVIGSLLLAQNSNVRLVGKKWKGVGDPTDTACAVLGWKLDSSVDEYRKRNPRFREYPFDRTRKRMSAIHEFEGERRLFVKGALGDLIQVCDRTIVDGKVVPMTRDLSKRVQSINADYASDSLRILGLATRLISESEDIENVESVESGLVLLGVIGISDPPRSEVPEAISTCHEAGIRVIMITGDHKSTAESIGEEIGIFGSDDLSIHGTELRDMDDEELDSILDRVAIFSRTTPDQKLRIVSRLQHLGHVVAMTGDGDNDAPALSKSNIGISMGRAGTDVARDASDMVLQDDDFSSIVKAVDEGRRIYQNIRNFVRYQISTNVAAVLLLLVTTMLMDWTFPFTVTQLLVINILMDGPPAVALGVEQQAKDVMKEPPRPLDETLPTSTDALLIMFLGMIMVIGTASVFYFAGGAIIDSVPCSTGPAGGDDFMVNGVCNEDAWFQNAESQFAIAQTSAFAAFIFFQLMNVMNCRSSEVSAFRLGITSNSWITISILISTTMLLLFVHAPEIAGFRIGEMIHTVPLKPLDWLVVLAVASSVFVAEEMRKMLWPKPKK